MRFKNWRPFNLDGAKANLAITRSILKIFRILIFDAETIEARFLTVKIAELLNGVNIARMFLRSPRIKIM